jgi:hypothetical protein
MEMESDIGESEIGKNEKAKAKKCREKLAIFRQSVQSCLTVKEEELDWKRRYENLKNAIQACVDLSFESCKVEPYNHLSEFDSPSLSIETNQNGNCNYDDRRRLKTSPKNETNQRIETNVRNKTNEQQETSQNIKTSQNNVTIQPNESNQNSDQISEIKEEYEEDFSTIDHDHAYQAIPDSEENLEELFRQLENNVSKFKNSENHNINSSNCTNRKNNDGDCLVEESDAENKEPEIEDHEVCIEDQEEDSEKGIEVEVLEPNSIQG